MSQTPLCRSFKGPESVPLGSSLCTCCVEASKATLPSCKYSHTQICQVKEEISFSSELSLNDAFPRRNSWRIITQVISIILYFYILFASFIALNRFT